jgi:hypothetical protein
VFPDPCPRTPWERCAKRCARAEFLGVHRGNRSALDLLGEIRRAPPELDVIRRGVDRPPTIRIAPYQSFEAADSRRELEVRALHQRQVGAIETDPRRLEEVQRHVGLAEDGGLIARLRAASWVAARAAAGRRRAACCSGAALRRG